MTLLNLKKGDFLSISIVSVIGTLEATFHENGSTDNVLLGSWGKTSSLSTLKIESLNNMDHSCSGTVYFHAKDNGDEKFCADFVVSRFNKDKIKLNEVPIHIQNNQVKELVKSIPITVEESK